MLAAVIDGPAAVVVRSPPGAAARAQEQAASDRPGRLKAVPEVAGP